MDSGMIAEGVCREMMKIVYLALALGLFIGLALGLVIYAIIA